MKTATVPPWHKSGVTGFYDDKNKFRCTGSLMGRRDWIPDDSATVLKMRLSRVALFDGGAYDKGGAYWGYGSPLFCAWGESATEKAVLYFRASSRMDAKALVLQKFTNAKIHP